MVPNHNFFKKPTNALTPTANDQNKLQTFDQNNFRPQSKASSYTKSQLASSNEKSQDDNKSGNTHLLNGDTGHEN